MSSAMLRLYRWPLVTWTVLNSRLNIPICSPMTEITIVNDSICRVESSGERGHRFVSGFHRFCVSLCYPSVICPKLYQGLMLGGEHSGFVLRSGDHDNDVGLLIA